MHNVKCLLSVIGHPQHHWSGCDLAQFIYRWITEELHLTSAFSSNKNIQNSSSIPFGIE